MTDDEALLRAYDEQLRAVRDEQPGLTVEADGPLVRVAGQVRGFVDGPRDLGVTGAGLDTLIARQRDFFAARGEAVEWKTRGHDLPADLPQRLLSAGFVPEEQETVLAGVAADMAGDPVLPAGVALRQVTAEADLRAIAAMESEIWDEDWGWLTPTS